MTVCFKVVKLARTLNVEIITLKNMHHQKKKHLNKSELNLFAVALAINDQVRFFINNSELL
jgi:hypothetical protein